MNWAVDPEECARRDRVRTKLFASMFTTYGYAILAGALWTPLTAGGLSNGNLFMAVCGFALHALALYITPKGEL